MGEDTRWTGCTSPPQGKHKMDRELHHFTFRATEPDDSVPAACQMIKGDIDKCIKEKGLEHCKDLIDAFQACMKTLSDGSQ